MPWLDLSILKKWHISIQSLVCLFASYTRSVFSMSPTSNSSSLEGDLLTLLQRLIVSDPSIIIIITCRAFVAWYSTWLTPCPLLRLCLQLSCQLPDKLSVEVRVAILRELIENKPVTNMPLSHHIVQALADIIVILAPHLIYQVLQVQR